MANGVVKWFNNAKGYGFVCVDGVDEDVLVHHSMIQMDGYRTLKAGQSVSLELVRSPKGLQAQNVVPAGEASAPRVVQAVQASQAAEETL